MSLLSLGPPPALPKLIETKKVREASPNGSPAAEQLVIPAQTFHLSVDLQDLPASCESFT